MDVIRDAEQRFFDTLSLNSLLGDTDIPFRQAVIGALIREGFELEETDPCLQHPTEILQALHWLDTLGFGSTWESFRQALMTAGKLGVLMDLSNYVPTPMLLTPSVEAGMPGGYHQSHLEFA